MIHTLFLKVSDRVLFDLTAQILLFFKLLQILRDLVKLSVPGLGHQLVVFGHLAWLVLHRVGDVGRLDNGS